MSYFTSLLKTLQSHLTGTLEVNWITPEEQLVEVNWITPEEQLERLPSNNISLLTQRISAISELIPDLANIVAEYAVDDLRLDGWYTSLQCINRLPKKIPPLPGNILKILNEPCPDKICSKKKPDGATYTIGEKCTLTLVAEELGTINEIENVVKDYGATQYPENKNPLRFRYFGKTGSQEYGNMPPGPTHWVLHTNDVLENSRNQSYENQEGLVNSLAKKSSKDWQVPNLRDTIATIFLKKIATEESLYRQGNDQNKNTCTHTRVKEKAGGDNLVVGGFALGGLFVDDLPFDSFIIGVAALRKF